MTVASVYFCVIWPGFCLGTTIRASVHIKLPKISKNQDEFHKIAARYNLQVRGTAGEHSDSIGGIYDISNKVWDN